MRDFEKELDDMKKAIYASQEENRILATRFDELVEVSQWQAELLQRSCERDFSGAPQLFGDDHYFKASHKFQGMLKDTIQGFVQLIRLLRMPAITDQPSVEELFNAFIKYPKS
jgi:hypothetical protein